MSKNRKRQKRNGNNGTGAAHEANANDSDPSQNGSHESGQDPVSLDPTNPVEEESPTGQENDPSSSSQDHQDQNEELQPLSRAERRGVEYAITKIKESIEALREQSTECALWLKDAEDEKLKHKRNYEAACGQRDQAQAEITRLQSKLGDAERDRDTAQTEVTRLRELLATAEAERDTNRADANQQKERADVAERQRDAARGRHEKFLQKLEMQKASESSQSAEQHPTEGDSTHGGNTD